MKKTQLIFFICALFLGVQITYAFPEKIFINAQIFTADESTPTAQALAVENGKILAIGEQSQVLRYKTPQTQIIDLQNMHVLPGLIDAHVHAVIGALAELSPNLKDEELGITSLSLKVRHLFNEHKHDPSSPFVVFGVNPATWSDPKALERVFNQDFWYDKPLVLMGSDLHTAWGNHVMLGISGITKEFINGLPDSQKHTIGVDSTGNPNGVLIDAGVDLVTIHLNKPNEDTLLKAARLAVQKLNQYGITAWMDPAANAGPGEALFSRPLGSTGTGVLPAYSVLSKRGELTAHVVALLVASPLSNAADLELLAEVRLPFTDIPNLTIPGIKIFADGVLEYPAQSAALLGQYINSNKHGEMLISRQALHTLVDAADEKGWLVHVHALGDRAVREALDAFEFARHNRNSGINHSITHLQLVNEQDYIRFKDLQIIAVMQLLWAEADNYLLDLVKPYISESEFINQYPARSLQENGAVIAGASDWPISTANPWEAMHHAITRHGLDTGLNQNERLDIHSMLLAYTRNAALAIGLQEQIGTLSVGKQADFIVIDRDVLTVDVESLLKTQVIKTFFAGQEVYSSN